MLCKRCLTEMRIGTTYEQDKNGKFKVRRFFECKKCHEKVYIKEDFSRNSKIIDNFRNK